MTDCILPKMLVQRCRVFTYSPVTEATDGGLNTLIRLMVKCSCLEVPGCCSSTATYEVCDPLGCCCPLDTI